MKQKDKQTNVHSTLYYLLIAAAITTGMAGKQKVLFSTYGCSSLDWTAV